MSSQPRCGCCHTTVWEDDEITLGICTGCKQIAEHPGRYAGRADIDVTFVTRRVRSLLYTSQRLART